MTDLRKAAEMMAYEVPLHELLEGVPENARLVIDSEDGMSTSFIPVGLYCKRAASALRQALAQPEAEIERLKKEVEHLRQAYHRVKDENERLSLDLGIKNNPQFGKPY